MDIFQNIESLRLPADEFVVVGGGPLAAIGIDRWQEGDDIDLAVSDRVLENLRAQGWQEEWAGKLLLKHGPFDVGVGFGPWDLEDLQANALTIRKIPFMSLWKVLQWKQENARPKDHDDIRIIEQFLLGHSGYDAASCVS